MTQSLHWIAVHFDTILTAILWIAGLVLAHGWAKKAYYQVLLKSAVAFVEQYRKAQAKLKADNKPYNDTPPEILKQLAVDYVQVRFPGVDITKLHADIEAAVHLVGTLKNPVVQLVAGQLDKFIEGLPDPTPSRPASISAARRTVPGG